MRKVASNTRSIFSSVYLLQVPGTPKLLAARLSTSGQARKLIDSYSSSAGTGLKRFCVVLPSGYWH